MHGRSMVVTASRLTPTVRVQLITEAQKDAGHVNDLALARKIAIEKRKEQEEQRLLQAEELEHAKRLQIARQTEAAEEDRRRADRSACQSRHQLLPGDLHIDLHFSRCLAVTTLHAVLPA